MNQRLIGITESPILLYSDKFYYIYLSVTTLFLRVKTRRLIFSYISIIYLDLCGIIMKFIKSEKRMNKSIYIMVIYLQF